MHLWPASVRAATCEDHMRGESGQPWMRTHVKPLGDGDEGSVTTAGSTRGGDRSFIFSDDALALLTTPILPRASGRRAWDTSPRARVWSVRAGG